MVTITLQNAIGKDFIKAIKALLKTKPKSLYTIKTSRQKKIPTLDLAIKEFESGEFEKCKSFEEYQKKPELRCFMISFSLNNTKNPLLS